MPTQRVEKAKEKKKKLEKDYARDLLPEETA